MREYGGNLRQAFATPGSYPRYNRDGGARLDARPPSGVPAGADLPFMRQQHLDPNRVDYGVLQPLRPIGIGMRNQAFGESITAAVNEWQIGTWIGLGRAPQRLADADARRPGIGAARDRPPRRRSQFRPGLGAAARAGAAGPAALLADLRGGRGARQADRHPCRRHQRHGADQRRLVLLLCRGASLEMRGDAGAGHRAWCSKACSSGSRNCASC